MTNFITIVLNVVENVKGCEFATLCYETACGFPKYSGLDQVEKRVVVKSVNINYSYESVVNNRATKESGANHAIFHTQSLPFGKWRVFNKTIVHNGEYYLRYYLQPKTIIEETYFENGQPCSPLRVQQINAFLANKPKHFSQKQAAAGLTTNQVEPRVLSIKRLQYIKVNGVVISNC